MSRVLSICGAIAIFALVLLGAGRMLRADGAIDIDDLNSAQAAALSHIIGKYFKEARQVDVTGDGGQVMDTVLNQVRMSIPSAKVTSVSRVQVKDGVITKRLDQDEDTGRHFDVRIGSTPLYRVWIMDVSSGNCGYSATLVKLSATWRVLNDEGGCIFSTPVEPI